MRKREQTAMGAPADDQRYLDDKPAICLHEEQDFMAFEGEDENQEQLGYE